MKFQWLLLIWLLAECCLAAQETTAPPRALQLSLQASVNFGPVDGYMQTPAGGEPGTSSHKRPTFDELNIDDTVFYDILLKAQWHRLGFFGGYQFIRLDESAVLSKDLISRGVSFPAGTRVHTDDQFDWYHFGAGWKFTFLKNRLELFPKIEGAVFDFSYKLSGTPQSVSRSYTKGAVRLGLESTYHLNQRLSLNLDGAASIPISNTPQIATVTATVNYKLFRERHVVNPSIFVGVGAEWIDYEDDQKLSNHVRLELGPCLTAGFSLSF